MSTPEGAILKQIMDWLASSRVLAFRMNTGAMSGEHRGKKWFMRFGTPGMGDILAFPIIATTRTIVAQGGFYDVTLTEQCPTWLEVKTLSGKQSELQKSFQKQVEEYGHRYFIVRSVEEVITAFERMIPR